MKNTIAYIVIVFVISMMIVSVRSMIEGRCNLNRRGGNRVNRNRYCWQNSVSFVLNSRS